MDETAILYKEDPIYQIVDAKGKVSDKDQELWEEVKTHSRYLMNMDKLDRWTRLLGTVLVKVSFVDPDTGNLVEKNEGGQVQLDLMHGGVYDLKHGASPYYITELLIGFGSKFGGFAGMTGPGYSSSRGGHSSANIADPSNYGSNDISQRQKVARADKLGNISRIYWSPDSHIQHDDEGSSYEIPNPYGLIPAVPFFNQDPAHYYYLPINEPLIYANHAVNMRISDLNHIAKFQSFGIPVVTGIERPNSLRAGRPVDDLNQLKGGGAQPKFGGIGGISGFGAGGAFRTFDAGLGIFRDGNADANALGFSIGPDTAIAVGEKGDFKFAHPNADITGLLKTIEAMTDIIRINHGLQPKYKDKLPASGFALWMEKAGVIDENRRRGKMFKEREQQLFQVIKKLWNTHHTKSGEKRFSEDCKMEVTYIEPKFPVDPKTNMETITMESNILSTGSRRAFKKLYPWMGNADINKIIKQQRSDSEEQMKAEADVVLDIANKFKAAGLEPPDVALLKPDTQVTGSDNKVKHAESSSKQPRKTGDQRRKDTKTK